MRQNKFISFRADETTWRKLWCIKNRKYLDSISLDTLWNASKYAWNSLPRGIEQ